MILLAFLAIVLVGVAAVLVTGRIGPGRWRPTAPEAKQGEGGAVLHGATAATGLAEPDPRLPPVLLPEHPVAADIADLRFSVGLRGYRMDQVDEVLKRLAAALLERDAALAVLREARPERPEHQP
jgi:DivIVA domain-containing protein